METKIHPSAIVEDGAELDEGVSVGAFAWVGARVQIGSGTIVHHHATVEGPTTLGQNNEIFPYAYVGAKTHDLKYREGEPGLRIGDRNVFREYVSVHRATNEGVDTILGNDNVLLAYSHVAHECIVGNHLVMSSHSALGGHVEVEDHCNVGWGVGIHQFCRLGSSAMAGACSKVVQDVPPFMIADGNPAEVRTINKVGLERRGFSNEDIMLIRSAFKTLYRGGVNRAQALELLGQHPQSESPHLQRLMTFIKASQRGIA